MDEQIKMSPEPSGSAAVRILRQRAKDGTLREIWDDWKWIWSFCRGHWNAILLYTLCGIVSSGIGLAAGIVSKYLIDSIIAQDSSRMIPMAICMVLSGLVALVFGSVTARFSAKLHVTMLNEIRGKVFESLLSAEWLELRQFSTGDLLSRFSGDVSTIANCAVSWLPTVVIQVFTVLSTLAVVLYYDPVMALIAFASTPVLIFASRRLLRRQRSYQQKMRTVSSELSAFQSETFRNVDTLKSFGVEAEMEKKHHFWQEKYRDVTLEYNRFSVRTQMGLTMLGNLVQYLALGYCLWRLWRGDILFGTMVLFLQQRSKLSGAFSSLISQIPTALSGSVAAERVRELTQLKKETRSSAIAWEGGCRLDLKNVQASYEDHRKVLSHVDLHAGAGEVVALVGPSGEGKSTLMRLMLGLIQPEAGELYLTDDRGTRFPLGADTRHLFAYVPQGNTVLAGSIADNLRLVNPEATEEEMIAALRDACAWDFVRQLPRTIHSPIGEGGKGFSEGQAQRIAIARALMRKAPVMLLDEVTSALDPETEQRVLENLMRRGVTCIVSTHRPAVLQMCAGAYRVQDGMVEKI